MQELSSDITEEMENDVFFGYCDDYLTVNCPYASTTPPSYWEEGKEEPAYWEEEEEEEVEEEGEEEEEEEDSGMQKEVEETAELQVGATEDESELLMQEEAVEQTPDVSVNENDDEDERWWVKFNIRDPYALSMYRSLLEEDGAHVPSAGPGEIACYYLGGLIYAHVFAREDDDGIKIDIRQWRHRLEGDDVDGSYEVIVTSRGLVLSWDEWKRLLYYRKKIAYCSRDIMADRRIEEKYEFGKNKFISVSWPYRCINLRSRVPKDQRGLFFPEKIGVTFEFTEYERLMLLEEDLLRLSDQHQDSQHEKRMQQRRQQTTAAKKVKSISQQSLVTAGIKRKALQRCDESVTADTTIPGKAGQQKQNRE